MSSQEKDVVSPVCDIAAAADVIRGDLAVVSAGGLPGMDHQVGMDAPALGKGHQHLGELGLDPVEVPV